MLQEEGVWLIKTEVGEGGEERKKGGKKKRKKVKRRVDD